MSSLGDDDFESKDMQWFLDQLETFRVVRSSDWQGACYFANNDGATGERKSSSSSSSSSLAADVAASSSPRGEQVQFEQGMGFWAALEKLLRANGTSPEETDQIVLKFKQQYASSLRSMNLEELNTMVSQMDR